MDEQTKIYAKFLGSWILIPESCEYNQGDPPLSGNYHIIDEEGTLTFYMDWQDAQGVRHEVKFSGIPDGRRVPFNGGELADELSVHAISGRELNSYAFFKGKELMVAQRQLDETGGGMRVVQLVRLPNGESLVNTSVYRKLMTQ